MALLESMQGGFYRLDEKSRIQSIHPTATQLLGWASHELLGEAPHTLFHPHPTEETDCPLCTHTPLADRQEGQSVFWRKDGTSFPIAYTCTPCDKRGPTQGMLVIFRDITQQKIQEKQDWDRHASRIAISALLETSIEPLSLSQQMRVALDIILSVPWLSVEFKGSIATLDEGSNALRIQASIGLHESLLVQCDRIPMGHCLCGLTAQTRQTLFVNHVDQRHHIQFPGMEDHGHYCLPIINKGKLLGVLNCYIPAGADYKPEEEAFLATAANTLAGIIERRQLEQELEGARLKLAHAATHDSMTNLPNKALFLEHLTQSLARAGRDKREMALLFIDLDRFKYINDTFGHDVGDLLLVEVAKRMKEALRAADLVARLGGDEFAAILNPTIPPRSHPTTEEEAVLVANKIINLLQQPFYLKGHTCQIGSSIGISLFPTHGETVDQLIKQADLAMYAVKQGGRNHCVVFNKEAF